MWTEQEWNKFDYDMSFESAIEWFKDHHGYELSVESYQEYQIWYTKTFTKLGRALQ